jgi:hypothetical protein
MRLEKVTGVIGRVEDEDDVVPEFPLDDGEDE